ncbi:MAG: class I SAM-dependent methyltransferase [Acidobacteriota bacterium]|nr:class I SAM-dependent methyltransferase [Acidobacteriota bacterium]
MAADAEQLPFQSNVFQRVECDAVLEHVRNPERVMSEIHRVLTPGGYVHLVTPFCHPYHEYPNDFRRFTIDGLKVLAGPMEVAAEGWRTGATATLLVISIEYVKLRGVVADILTSPRSRKVPTERLEVYTPGWRTEARRSR